MSLCTISYKYFIGAFRLMAKEIERKWIYNYDFGDPANICPDDILYIRDYYFNQYTRLRNMEGIWYITIKSDGDLIREENEFTIDKSEIDFVPAPMLRKYRMIKEIDGITYEVNIFIDIPMDVTLADGTENILPLVTIEAELPCVTTLVTPPEFCDEEITYVPEFYGYNLFSRLREKAKKSLHILKEKPADIINMKDFLDKRKS